MFAIVPHNSIIPARRVVHLNPFNDPPRRPRIYSAFDIRQQSEAVGAHEWRQDS